MTTNVKQKLQLPVTRHNYQKACLDYQKLVMSIAHSFTKTTPMTADELISEGIILLLQELRELRVKDAELKVGRCQYPRRKIYGLYNPERSAFTTYLTMRLRSKFISYNYRHSNALGIVYKGKTQENAPLNVGDSLDDVACVEESIDSLMYVKGIIKSVSKEAKEVLRLVLESPAEFMDIATRDYSIKPKLKLNLLSKGWKPVTVTHAFDEIKLALKG